MKVAVNLMWCVPGEVGGSEQYLVRQLAGALEARPTIDLTVVATPAFVDEHRDLLAGARFIAAPVDGRRRWQRIAAERTWLFRCTRDVDLVQHGGGTAPSPARRPFLLTIHDLQFRTFPQYFSRRKRAYLSAVIAPGDISTERLIALALARRPDLAERDAAVVQADADVMLARREALPNLIGRVVSEQHASGTGRALRPGVGLTIPLFNRNQGAIDARRAFARQVTLERAATAARVRADVEIALRAYQAAAGEIEVLETTVLGPARENRRLLEFAYREGKVGLPVLLLIRNQVIDAELDYWAAWLAEREADANLAEVTSLNSGAGAATTPIGAPQ